MVNSLLFLRPIVATCSLGFFVTPLSGQFIDLSAGTAAQSSQLNDFSADLALDGVSNFTHTFASDTNPTWQVLLPSSFSFDTISIVGRATRRQRLRDITIEVISFNGDVNSDFTGGTVVYSSPLLNPDNILDGPTSLTAEAGDAIGNMIRVRRTPDPDSSGDDASVISLDEVTAVGSGQLLTLSSDFSSYTPGDPVELSWEMSSNFSSLTIDQGVGNVLPLTSGGSGSIVINPGPNTDTLYTLTAVSPLGSSSVSTMIQITDNPLIYSFTADDGLVDAGETVTLSWEVSGNTTTLWLDGVDVTGQTSATVTPNGQEDYVFAATNTLGVAESAVTVFGVTGAHAIISEFGASNNEVLEDEDGDASDWIEIFNPSNSPLNLGGYFLTDDESELNQWAFPPTILGAGERLIVFASSKNRAVSGEELHTNFGLSSSGEYLALVEPDGISIATEFAPEYPNQRTDVSYGFDTSIPRYGYFAEPTPGAENGESFLGLVQDTSFSTDRGFYDSPISVEITSQTNEAVIRYTTDGSNPTANTGFVYDGTPLAINETTILRAAAFKEGFLPTDVDTQSYIFPADVVTQPTMRTEVTQDPVLGPQLIDSLNSIPTISLTFESLEDNDINRIEIPASVELLNFEDEAIQVDAGVARFGSRATDFEKRSFRIEFRREYGPSRLEFPLFPAEGEVIPPVSSFDSLDIRAGNHDMVSRGAYLGNRFADDSLLDMSQIAPHGRFVHIYFNGEYRGQYHLRERWSAEMLSDYLPGDDDEYDTINANNAGREFQVGDVTDGDDVEWNQIQADLAGPTPYADVKDLLDIGNMIDFMLVFTYGTSESEFRAGGSAENGVGFKFFLKDGDGFLQPPNFGFQPSGGFYPATHNGPLNSMTALRNEADPEFMTLLADRIHLRLFNDGALTPEESTERLMRRVDETRLSYISETARWASHDNAIIRTPEEWEVYHQFFFDTEFPMLTDQRIELLEEAGMYPDIDAPVYIPHGGAVGQSGLFTVSVSDSVPTVYYQAGPASVDPQSLDPRLVGGAINPAASLIQLDSGGDGVGPTDFVNSGDDWRYLDTGADPGSSWNEVGFNDFFWEVGPSELGYGDGDEDTVVDFVDTNPSVAGAQRNATTFFRKTDVLVADPTAFENFTLNYVFDDGIAIYINGVEVVRENLATNAAFDEFATATVGNNATGTVTLDSSLFVVGNNTIAAEVHQVLPTSSDISFDLELTGNPPGGGATQTVALALSEPSWVVSRSFDPGTGEWSALNFAFFSLESVPADASNLVVSQIHYNPAPPSTAAEFAVLDEDEDEDEFEFIELLNVGPFPIDLSGVVLSGGISFSFGPTNEIPVGGRLVVVENDEAFEARYASTLGSVVFATDLQGESQYGGRLMNSGEQIILTSASGEIIRNFAYDDRLPWPTVPDGRGYSLVLRNPTSLPDHSIGSNWAASAEFGGSPGVSSAVGFAGDPSADLDGDGISALLEYALASSDSVAGDSALTFDLQSFTVGTETEEYLTASFVRNHHAQNAFDITAEVGTDLINWNGAPDVVLVSEVDNGNDTSTMVYRSATSIGEHPLGREFIRVFVSEEP